MLFESHLSSLSYIRRVQYDDTEPLPRKGVDGDMQLITSNHNGQTYSPS